MHKSWECAKEEVSETWNVCVRVSQRGYSQLKGILREHGNSRNKADEIKFARVYLIH